MTGVVALAVDCLEIDHRLYLEANQIYLKPNGVNVDVGAFSNYSFLKHYLDCYWLKLCHHF